jgi:DNA uptake protein ComE-like DNA-binding protein
MNAAGGRNLLERWSDRALMDFNVDVNNAITHYEAFYMVRILDGTSQLATQSQDAARAEANAASRRADEAMNLYRRLK